MGHKVQPKCFRLGVTTTWNSKWFSKKRTNYKESLKEDVLIREYLFKELKKAGVTEVEIERAANNIKLIISTTRPGIIIGRGGQGTEELKQKIKDKFFKQKKSVRLEINIQEIKNIGLSAKAVAQGIASDIERRMPFRRIMKRSIDQSKKSGAQGIKVKVSGRLDGAEIAREETLNWGKIPLHTIRADIDYAQETAFTTYGTIGIKIWIYKGEIFEKKKVEI